MEANERPSKIRKLDPVGDELMSQHVPDVPYVANGQTSTNPVDESRPAGDATANLIVKEAESDLEKQDIVNQKPQTVDPAQTRQPPLSKNQLKKLRKREAWDAGKDWRKAKRKTKKQEKKARTRAERQEELANQESNDADTTTTRSDLRPGPQTVRRHHSRLPVTFILDCGFDDLMMEKERISLGSQLTRSYSDNNKAPFQAHLYVSSWGQLLKERFETVLRGHYKNWRGMKFIPEDFVSVAESAKVVMNGPKGGKMVGAFAKYAIAEKEANGHDIEPGDSVMEQDVQPATHEEPVTLPTPLAAEAETTHDESTNTTIMAEQQRPVTKATTDDQSQVSSSLPLPTGEVIYLTSDSPDTLEELKPHHIYIIGGLVDKNRHKGICYKTARDRGIKTAKLPIGQYMEMQSRFVLATNHVVDIMVKWLECGDWGEAFMRAIPKRKGGVLKDGKAVESNAEGEQGSVPEEVESESDDEAADTPMVEKSSEDGHDDLEDS